MAFLRAINVGGRNIAMQDLCRIFSAMGFDAVHSVVASGNIIFTADSDAATGLEDLIEMRLADALGYEVATFLRAPSDLDRALAEAPFDGESGSHTIGFLKEPPGDAVRAATCALASEVDRIAFVGRELHWLRPDPSASTLVNGRFERALGSPATFRTIGTVRRIVAKCTDR